MFQTLVVQPIFNLLVFIYAILPGHNFGAAIIIFTIVVRLLMWPLVKKQLHHAKAMRKLQPELKRIKQETKGDRQKESLMVMELYKERQISPFGTIGILIVQLIILLGLYSGLSKVVKDPQAIIDNSYPWLRDLSWLKQLGSDISRFDASLFGVIDLKRAAIGPFYFPAFLLVVGSAAIQYFQSSQLMPQAKDGRKLREILKEAGNGKQADQAEINAAIGKNTKFIIPFMIFFFTVGLPAALSLYWLVGGLVAYIQQAQVLKQDETELEAIADASVGKEIIEGEIIEKPKTKKKKPASKKSKRRK
ncbi:membrane protein insertase YidC [Candidatus Saccharibacteria bacterium]|nr:membrane protein insertase YidC [Candidatus Saccharibacteria bacterium]